MQSQTSHHWAIFLTIKEGLYQIHRWWNLMILRAKNVRLSTAQWKPTTYPPTCVLSSQMEVTNTIIKRGLATTPPQQHTPISSLIIFNYHNRDDKNWVWIKKRKKKYRKSIIGKGLSLANHEYVKNYNVPDTTHAFVSTQYFQDNRSCDVPDELAYNSEWAREALSKT